MRLNKDGSTPEFQIQKAFIEYITLIKIRKYVFSIPNESATSVSYGRKLKLSGLRKGASDIFIAIPCKGFHGFFLELKSENGKLRKEQKEFFKDMEIQGYFTSVCYSLDEAINMLQWYLK